jgi:uncharacterized protein YdeI (YjbR/CyaY-like superfamily)
MTVAEPELHVESRQEWRGWLAANHASSEGVWVVTWKRPTGRPRPTYEDLVEEAVCFGWIDSSVRSVDEERHAQRMTPRRNRSKWSESNRGRVERLEAAGLMTEAGRAAVERAKLDGTWLSAP